MPLCYIYTVSLALGLGFCCGSWGEVMERTTYPNIRITNAPPTLMLHHTPKATGVDGIFELPEGVAGEVGADEELPPPGQAEGFVAMP